jgi:hypothetical protein
MKWLGTVDRRYSAYLLDLSPPPPFLMAKLSHIRVRVVMKYNLGLDAMNKSRKSISGDTVSLAKAMDGVQSNFSLIQKHINCFPHYIWRSPSVLFTKNLLVFICTIKVNVQT